MSNLDYLCDELARYDIEIDNRLERRIKRLLTLGYSCAEIAKGINPKFVWDEDRGRLDAVE
jgi:DNA-binding CsgD family transcriptional regulator